MPFLSCAACGCDTHVPFAAEPLRSCRSCAAPLAGDSVEDSWMVRAGHPGFDVIKVGGALVAEAVEGVRDELRLPGDGGVVLDLAYCTFIDAAGIELIAEATVAAGGDPSFFSVVGARGAVAQMIDFADGGGAIPRFPDLAAAIAEIEREPTMM